MNLKNKKRTVKDIITYLKTRSDKVANYSLLIGAGASITSGIRSAGDLVSSWREDIYSQYKPDEIYTEEKSKRVFL